MATHPSLVLAATVALAAVLAAISITDFRRQIIPDGLNLALAGIGLSYQLAADAEGVPVQILFAAATFAAAWLLRRGHFLMTGRIGLGLGDVKMLAAASCWISPLLLPVLLFIASASALLFVGGQVVATGPAAARARVAFGPFIAIGLGASWALEQFAGLDMGLL
ncbi:prepilin peptidase [Mesorhizobium sp. WSM4312]|uniref:prepilin peptidase n=1 Tax=unclassified Mesorhizobium TaxID=325217 RepID=UPI000BAE8066|nr:MULTISPECIES: A24 family peptidase [unclassified Mesorhizobium]PBB27848.1 prepilin peptidase [Mesorhizobium sp. WSM4304]PBB64400.1 prepilin peptidase [Mesorhizobium sp. WSM4312]PBB77456.1 prepilin peptidase [Mesorhizobium sp. WSM4308]PBC18831.1 prepilin peptidase [Mesorhizobium sp. WSM4311]TRD01139.1 prepilin peptidase [Mesorhizobium sp. WSM4305]